MATTFAQVRRREEILKDATIREFNGGLNVIDSDLNLSTEFAKILDNVYRAKDGTISVRYGTRLLADIQTQITTTGLLVANALSTTIRSANIRVRLIAHGLLSGHSITIARAGAVGGISSSRINKSHTVTVINANNFIIRAATNATSTTTGGGTSMTFSHNNKKLTGNLINMTYFQDMIVAIDDNGEIAQFDSSGVGKVIFNGAMALKLAGSPSGWSATTFASFAVFGGELIICNGVDKPLLVDLAPNIPVLPVQYLQDLGTGSNVNTPICRYVAAMDHYVLMAGDPLHPGVVHISNFDTSGTWLGDPVINDAVDVNIGKVVASTNFTIRGIVRFRDHAIVVIDDNVIIGTLGEYDADDNHKPDFSDVVEQHGSISHRSLQALGDDLLMVDVIGVPSIKRTLLTNTLRPERASELIDPLIQEQITNLSIGSSEDRIFSVYNQREGQYMMFIPNADTIDATTETTCYVYTVIPSLKIKAWSRFKGWNWTCACRSSLRRVFFGGANKIYVYGGEDDKIYGDKINDSAISDPNNGDPIKFQWQLPWADFSLRAYIKRCRYIGFDTQGDAPFTAKMYVDNILLDGNDNDNPMLSMQFVGGDGPGFGAGGQPYGGGRRTSDERLWAWPAKFKIGKLDFSGTTTKKLKFVSITLLYKDGSIRR